jgi:hypothetical protein
MPARIAMMAMTTSNSMSVKARGGDEVLRGTMLLMELQPLRESTGQFESGEPVPEPERFNWIGRAGCVFFRKSFVVHSLRAYNRPAPRSRLVLRKNPLRHPFPPN